MYDRSRLADQGYLAMSGGGGIYPQGGLTQDEKVRVEQFEEIFTGKKGPLCSSPLNHCLRVRVTLTTPTPHHSHHTKWEVGINDSLCSKLHNSCEEGRPLCTTHVAFFVQL